VNALQGEPDTIDPSRSSFNTEAAVIRQVFEPLLRFDIGLRPQPAAAETYEVSSDGRHWTFHLRPDGRWSDGAPVTARDFEYSLKRLLDPKTASEYASFFVDAGIVGAEAYNAGQVPTPDGLGIRALDELTLQIDLVDPFGPLPDLVALWVAAPLRRDVVEAYGDSWTLDPATYIGNGPFVMTEWVHQDHIAFTSNRYYHGPAPVLQKMTFLMVGNGAAD
jgi:oligopeptide transport system substrate-binding protein